MFDAWFAEKGRGRSTTFSVEHLLELVPRHVALGKHSHIVTMFTGEWF